MKLKTALRPGLFSVCLSVAYACGPKEPPRQATTTEQPDPMTENSPAAASAPPLGDPNGKGKPPSGPAGKAAPGKAGEPPTVASLSAYSDGIKWGTNHADLTKAFTATGGVLWKDYDEKLSKARVGPEQTALEAEREEAKRAFGRSFIEFKDTPTGYDTTGIRGEYTYKNKESLMWVQRAGKKRYFFFINDRLWKIYDEVPLGESTFVDQVNKISGQVGARGRTQNADPDKGINFPTVDWKDGTNRLRAVDRSSEHIIGLVSEDLSVLSNLAALRPNKPTDPNEIDPSITAVTRGQRSDPNAPASASAAGSGKKPPPAAPKKK